MAQHSALELKHLGILLHDCLKQMGWRLKAPARRRIVIDIAALCTSLRAVIMVDYAGKMPELQDHLCTLLALLVQEVGDVGPLRVMSMDDIAYLIHHDNFILYMDKTLNRNIAFRFVVLDDDTARFALPLEEEGALRHFECFKNHFLSILSEERSIPMKECTPCQTDHIKMKLLNAVVAKNAFQASPKSVFHKSFSSIQCLDLGGFLNVCEVPLPTLNGWLLGYPAIYLFKKENVSLAVRTLSAGSLHLFKFVIQSELTTESKPAVDELMSFTVPSELSSQGMKEQWVETSLTLMRSKMKDFQIWKSLELQLTSKICQSVVL